MEERSGLITRYDSLIALGVVPLTLLGEGRTWYGSDARVAELSEGSKRLNLDYPLSGAETSSKVTPIRLVSLPRRPPAGEKKELADYLLALRRSAREGGARLLNREEILEEVRSLRGELEHSVDDPNVS